MKRRRVLTSSALAALSLVAGCTGGGGGGDSGGGGGGESVTIEIRNLSFRPRRVDVPPGTEVVWVNRDSESHFVKNERFHEQATEWSFTSGNLSKGDRASHTFESEGIYEFYCLVHGQRAECGAVLVGDVSLDADLPCAEGGG